MRAISQLTWGVKNMSRVRVQGLKPLCEGKRGSSNILSVTTQTTGKYYPGEDAEQVPQAGLFVPDLLLDLGAGIWGLSSRGSRPHFLSNSRPLVRELIVWAVLFIVTNSFAGNPHLYKILWFLRTLVMGIRLFRAASVAWERSAYSAIPVYGSGRDAFCLENRISWSLIW